MPGRVVSPQADEGQRDDGQPEQGSFEAPTEVLLLQELDHVGRPNFVRSSVPIFKKVGKRFWRWW